MELVALSVAVTRFDAGRLAALPHAQAPTRALRVASARAGYVVTAVDDQPARALGATAERWLQDTAGGGRTRLVHVVSHGVHAGDSKKLRIVGSDGATASTTDVERWLTTSADDADGAVTLFLLDLCYSGELTEREWDARLRTHRRAWVIAASAPAMPAFNARLTTAAAAVLDHIDGDRLGLSTAQTHAPLDLFARHVVVHVNDQARDGFDQQVTTSLIGFSDTIPDLGFFPTPYRDRPPTSGLDRDVDTALAPYQDTIDHDLDPRHFISRARGLPPQAPGHARSCFTGYTHQTAALAAWLDGEQPGHLRLVTGEPGTGKSALLGVLIAAAHPQLRASIAWHTLPRAPRENTNLAAVHARHRDLTTIRDALARQLHLPDGAADTTDAFLHHLATQPTLVIDAVDEATNPAELHDFLLTLAHETDDDGRPVCRLLAAVRPWPQFQSLRDAAIDADGLVNLDNVDLATRHADLVAYVQRLLETIGPYTTRPDIVTAITDATTTTLSTLEERPERAGSAVPVSFLMTGLFVHHLLSLERPLNHRSEAVAVVRRLPRTLPDMVDLDLRHSTNPWMRPILASLAVTLGDGAPADIIAALTHNPGQVDLHPSQDDVQTALDDARFYLRTTTDIDGTLLYRLFHQHLADHLGAGAADNTTTATCLLQHVPTVDGAPQWSLAQPYLKRHLADHAIGTPVLDTLLADHEFLVHADPDHLGRALHHAQQPTSKANAAVYRTSHQRHRQLAHDPAARRQIFAIDALRHDNQALANELASSAAPSVWRPRWCTGGRASPQLRDTLTGHIGRVVAVACTFVDGTPVAVTTSDDTTVRVWDLADGTLRCTLSGHTDRVRGVACTFVDGTPVAVTTSDDSTVRVWGLADGTLRYTLSGHTDRVREVACTIVDGIPVAVTTSDDTTVGAWDLADGTLRCTLSGHTDRVRDVACTIVEGTPVAVTTSDDSTVRVWDLADGTLRHTLSGHTGRTGAVACTTIDGAPVAVTTSRDETVRMWDLVEGTLRHTFTGHTGWVVAVACTTVDDTPVAVTTSRDATARVWDLGDCIVRHTFTGHTSAVGAVACTTVHGAPVAVTTSDDATVRVWDLADGTLRHTLTGHTNYVMAAGCTTVDGAAVAVTASYDATVRVWDLANRAARQPLTGHSSAVVAVTCTTVNGAPVAVTTSWDETARVWDLADGRLRYTLTGHTRPVRAVACTTIDGIPLAVTTSEDATVRVWDLADGTLRQTLPGHTRPVVAVGCTTVDSIPVAVTASSDASVRVWNLPDGILRHTLTGHTDRVLAVACTTVDGIPVAVTTSWDETVRVWDLASGTLRHTLTGHTDRVMAVACTTVDGVSVAVTTSWDETVRVWDLPDGTLRHTLSGHTSWVLAVACTTVDGIPVAVTTSWDETVQVWDLASGILRHTLTGHTGAVVAVACTTVNGITVAVTTSDDTTVRVWDLADGTEQVVLILPGQPTRLAIAADGSILVVFDNEVIAYEPTRD